MTTTTITAETARTPHDPRLTAYEAGRWYALHDRVLPAGAAVDARRGYWSVLDPRDDERRGLYLHSAADLGAAVRDSRPDARAVGVHITNDWCRDQMHDLGISRYEDIDHDTLGRIAERVDLLAEEA
jgi:hypothetical protein